MIQTFIVDGQVLQTRAWSRGMGRYLLALLSGLTEQETPPRMVIVLNSLLDTDESKIEIIKKICPSAEIHILDLAPGLSEYTEKQNTKVLDHFIRKNHLEGSVFLQTSLFSFDFQPAYPTHTINTCIFYDMIPLKFWTMFYTYFPEHEYFSRFKYVYAADKIFSISKSVKNDLVKYLGFEEKDIVNINGADIPNFFDDEYVVAETSPRKEKYILLPGGDSPHKNMLRSIRGFDLFNAQFGDSYKLIITSFYSDENQKRMTDLSPNVELSGEVSDQELRDLFAHAELILFPSLDEGLGLPVLEAVSNDKKVACSSIGIFKELSKDAFHLFDPYSPDDIARALVECVTDENDEARKTKYDAVKNKFTWKKSAHDLMSAQVEKIEAPHGGKGKHSIIVEQDGTEGLRKELGSTVRRLYRTTDIDLFINVTAAEDMSATGGTPLVLSTFLHTRDISDAPRKASKDRTIIYTKDSLYTPAFEHSTDTIAYVGTNKKTVDTTFKNHFGNQKV